MYEYSLYGITVASDIPLLAEPYPGVDMESPGSGPTVVLEQLNSLAGQRLPARSFQYIPTHGRDCWVHTDRDLGPSSPGQPWCFEVRDVVSFRFMGGDPRIYYELSEQSASQLLVFWFLHIFLPLYLCVERGRDFIHASGVELDQGPVLFIAPSSGGKSTLADYFLRQGHALLSDDKVPTYMKDGQFMVAPAHPHHRPYRGFEQLGYPVDNFAREARPLHTFYLLEKGDPGSDVEITEVTGVRKFEKLLPNYLFAFRFLQQRRLRWLAQLADKSVVFTVRRPWNMDRMQETYEAIRGHARSWV